MWEQSIWEISVLDFVVNLKLFQKIMSCSKLSSMFLGIYLYFLMYISILI